jgi:hypothetical protein
MSDQIVRVRRCWLKFVGHFSGVSQTFWEGYVQPESMSVDTLGVYCTYPIFLAHLTQRVMWAIVTTESPSSVRPLTFHILINSSEATGSIWTKLWWNGPWMAPFQNCVRWSWLPTKMVAKLKIEKRGDEILIVDCCFSISQNELKF